MKTKLLPLICLISAGLFILASPGISRAQDQQGQEDQAPPPGRVADLQYMQGSVSYEPAGEQNWVDAETNRPLTTGDSLWSDQGSRAELFIGSTALRLGDSTGISFLNLNDQVAQVQLAEGTLEVNVRYLNSNDTYEIDTPNLAFSIARPGEYIIYADPNGGRTSVSVYSGEGSVSGGGQTYDVTPGQDALFVGTSQLSESVQRLPERDDFDSWARGREMREEHSVSSRYVSAGVTGYEDLDDYGSWHSDPDYGNYWVPNDVNSGWVPYHEGHWAWVAPWGWTWVDAEPWGFAPFHYGRWAMINGGWGWVPGPVAVAPVYAPALVGFVGGGGFGVAVSFGSVEGVGWFPLGPRDVYVPPYRVDPVYVQRINECDTRYINRTQVTTVYNNYTVNHVTYVNNYTYANNTRAVTVVNRNTFVNGGRVQQAAIRVNQQQIAHPRVVTTASLTPTRTSVVGAVARPVRNAPPVRPAAAHVVTRLKPSPRAEPLGKPRPATNPQLTNAVLQRSGYSPQLQMVHARAAASAPARNAAPAPAARPAPGRPGTPAAPPARPAPGRPEPRPATPPARPAPARPAAPPATRPGNTRPGFPPAEPRRNTTPPRRPFTPPNRPPARTTPPPREPNRTAPPPNRPMTRPESRPTPAMPPRNASPSRPVEPRPQPRPQPQTRPQPRPAPRPAERPQVRPQQRPQQRPQPERRPPPKKKPGGPGGDGSGGF